MQMLEKCRTAMQSQFDQWYTNLHSKGANALMAGGTHSYSGTSDGPSDFISASAEKSLYPAVSAQSKSEASSSHGDKGVSNNHLDNKHENRGRADDSDEVNEHIAAFNKAKEDMLRRQGR